MRYTRSRCPRAPQTAFRPDGKALKIAREGAGCLVRPVKHWGRRLPLPRGKVFQWALERRSDAERSKRSSASFPLSQGEICAENGAELVYLSYFALNEHDCVKALTFKDKSRCERNKRINTNLQKKRLLCRLIKVHARFMLF